MGQAYKCIVYLSGAGEAKPVWASLASIATFRSGLHQWITLCQLHAKAEAEAHFRRDDHLQKQKTPVTIKA